jgi:phage terminase large subunit
MEIDFPEWAEGLFVPKRNKFPRGGRGSSKSWTVARALAFIAHQPTLLFPKLSNVRILCARELQNSIEESVLRLLEDQIDLCGLRPFFDVQARAIYHRTNGSQFIFSGVAKNVTKIKSMEGINILWVEEGEKVSKNSWKVLRPTIREDDSEIWCTYNPDQENDPTHVMAVIDPLPDMWSPLVNWRDNPFFPKALELEKDYDFKVDPETAMHIWEGQCNTRSHAVIFRGKYISEEFTPVYDHDFDEFNWNGPYFGADWGFSNDPNVLMKMWIHGRTLYIEYESWGIGIDTDDLPTQWEKDVPGIEGYVIRADSQRPDTISLVRKYSGWNVVAAEKGPGSVEDGITFLLSFEQIVIHPRCTHMLLEAANYKYKVDPITGDVLKTIVDKWNHCWDAVRYALEPAIKSKRSIYDNL